MLHKLVRLSFFSLTDYFHNR